MPQTEVTIQTRGQGLYEFTDKVVDFVGRQGAEEGLLTVFVR
ncbi:MAG: YjbQ family protein, partial [Pseudomonadota bacterium]|nr:YjbQ family protein [Pseudomonadota bacterium]